MAAPDFTTLYDFETQMDSAWSAYLIAQGLSAPKQRGAAVLATPRVEVKFTTGAATGSMHPFVTAEYKPRPDRFAGSLLLRVVTNRTKNDSSHSTQRGAVRGYVADFLRVQTTDNLPYLWIFDIMDGGTTESTNDEDSADISDLTFNIKFGIRSDAWPVA
jgi:hypothetical protein